MELFFGMILLLQIVILIQIMQSKRQMLQCLKMRQEKAMPLKEDVFVEPESLACKESSIQKETPENAMKIVDEVLSEVFS